MATKTGIWKLQEVRDQILASDWITYDTSLDGPAAGTLWAWGSNYYGGLGDGTRINKSSPIQIPGTTWNDIADFGPHYLARKSL